MNTIKQNKKKTNNNGIDHVHIYICICMLYTYIHTYVYVGTIEKVIYYINMYMHIRYKLYELYYICTNVCVCMYV